MRSLAMAIGCDPKELESVVQRLGQHVRPPGLSPETHRACVLLAALGRTSDEGLFTSVVLHHGTRTLDPDAFWKRGLLPLPEIIDELWASLYTLVSEDLSPNEWRAVRQRMERGDGGHNGALYLHRLSFTHEHGPFGFLVREYLIEAPPPSVAYLTMPETVEDIAIEAETIYEGLDLRARFQRSAIPCVVSFEAPYLDGLCTAAIEYAYRSFAAPGELGGLSWSPGLRGERVAPSRILRVEPEPFAPSAWRA